MDWSSFAIVLGIVGSVASIVGVLIAAPGLKSKLIHVIYALALTATAGYAVAYHNQRDVARQQIEETHRTERQAQSILDSSDRSSEGSMKGFMLASLSFLEKNKQRFPETYARACRVAEASGLYQTNNSDSVEMTHYVNLQEGSSAMYFLLKGIASPPGR